MAKYFEDTNTMTFQDAINLTGPRVFNVMIKPAGSLCNLDCKYCYYLDKAEIYHGKEPKMTLEMLEQFTKEYIKANQSQFVTFNWHGGEPLVLGLDFYKKAVEFQQKYCGDRSSTIRSRRTVRSSMRSMPSSSPTTTGSSVYPSTARRISTTSSVVTRAVSRPSTK